jgi:hypothetical protein
MASATSRTRVPAGTARLDPSGSVTFTWLMELLVDVRRCAHAASGDSLRWLAEPKSAVAAKPVGQDEGW